MLGSCLFTRGTEEITWGYKGGEVPRVGTRRLLPWEQSVLSGGGVDLGLDEGKRGVIW